MPSADCGRPMVLLSSKKAGSQHNPRHGEDQHAAHLQRLTASISAAPEVRDCSIAASWSALRTIHLPPAQYATRSTAPATAPVVPALPATGDLAHRRSPPATVAATAAPAQLTPCRKCGYADDRQVAPALQQRGALWRNGLTQSAISSTTQATPSGSAPASRRAGRIVVVTQRLIDCQLDSGCLRTAAQR